MNVGTFPIRNMTIGNKHHSLGRLRPAGCMEGQLCPVAVVVQSLSHAQVFATPWTAARQVSLSFTNPWSLLKLMSIKSVMPSNHLTLVLPFSSCLQSFPSSGSFHEFGIILFFFVAVCMYVPCLLYPFIQQWTFRGFSCPGLN